MSRSFIVITAIVLSTTWKMLISGAYISDQNALFGKAIGPVSGRRRDMIMIMEEYKS